MPIRVNVLFLSLVVSFAVLYYITLSYFPKVFFTLDRSPVKPSPVYSTPVKLSSSHSTAPSFAHAEKDNIEKRRVQEIVVAVVACGDRLAETLAVLKSALIFTDWWQPLRFIVFSDDDLRPSFKEKLEEWKSLLNYTLEFEVHPITFPKNGNSEEWRKLFKPCASQRLFLPTVLSHVDSLLYVDTDTLFLAPLLDVWSHFSLMNTSQMAALASEHEDPNTGWYNRFAKHPFYGPLGVNSGVMLMNLTKMRNFKWEEYVTPTYKKYKLKITWGDQDIINIIFHYHPDKLYLYSCRYNYRTDHCMYMSVCHSAEKAGVAVLHGSRGTFHSEKQPAFRAIYRALEEYQLGTDPYQYLLLPMKAYLEETSSTNCGAVRSIFTIAMDKYIRQSSSEW